MNQKLAYLERHHQYWNVCTVLVQHMLFQMKSTEGRPVTFQHDNAKLHKCIHYNSMALQQKTLFWPACSSDFSPTENIWSIIIKQKIWQRAGTVQQLRWYNPRMLQHYSPKGFCYIKRGCYSVTNITLFQIFKYVSQPLNSKYFLTLNISSCFSKFQVKHFKALVNCRHLFFVKWWMLITECNLQRINWLFAIFTWIITPYK